MYSSMTFSSTATLTGALFFLAIVPGPSVFAVVGRSIESGFIHGFVTVLGIVAGDLIFILSAVYGLWSIAETASSLFALIKYLGSAYLIGLGIALWRSNSKTAEVSDVKKLSWLSEFLCGLFITLGDPKAILFYMSFLPAFLDLSNISIIDTGIIMVVATVSVGGAKLIYAYTADKSRLLLRSPRAKKGINIMAGSVMISTAIFLVAKT